MMDGEPAGRCVAGWCAAIHLAQFFGGELRVGYSISIRDDSPIFAGIRANHYFRPGFEFPPLVWAVAEPMRSERNGTQNVLPRSSCPLVLGR